MRDFFEFASKYAMAIDHTEWTAVNQKTREKMADCRGKSSNAQSSQFRPQKCQSEK